MSSLQFSFHPFRKIRIYLAWLFVMVLAVFAKSTPQGFLIGAPVILVGEAVRIWSHGYLRKSKELATSGPYTFVRNPLYLGNFLIGIGFCLIIWHPIVTVIFIVGFFLIYWVTIKGEEEQLSSKFGDAYTDYVRHVPRFFPRLAPYQNRLTSQFQFHRALNHGEHITILTMIILLLILYLRQELYQKHQPINGSILGFLALAVVLSLTTLFAMAVRYGYDFRRFVPFIYWSADIAKRMRRWRN